MTIPTNLNHGAKWAIVCQTVFQGLTMSQDDLYNTKLEADQELIELQSMLKEENAAASAEARAKYLQKFELD